MPIESLYPPRSHRDAVVHAVTRRMHAGSSTSRCQGVHPYACAQPDGTSSTVQDGELVSTNLLWRGHADVTTEFVATARQLTSFWPLEADASLHLRAASAAFSHRVVRTAA